MIKKEDNNLIRRPPVIAIMGHIDHGKSSLLDFIRKTNLAEKEAGGITQHITAYEVIHKTKEGDSKKITFLDTPGHEAFCSLRERGVTIADIAVLIVSAEDGVKPQTKEALECIKNDNLPFVVAINKIDKPGANIETTKQSLAESDVFVEGYGGKIPYVAISAKTGEGIEELLELLLLVADLEDFKADPSVSAEGIIIESNLDTKKGLSATVIIKNGTLKKGNVVISGTSHSPIRMLEDFKGKAIDEATFSAPVKIIGWDKIPNVGEFFSVVENKKEAQKHIQENISQQKTIVSEENNEEQKDSSIISIPIIIKADTVGSLEAIKYEISKIKNERIELKIILSAVGPIGENDIKLATTNENALVVGFDIATDPQARNLAERLNINIETFNIIYKLTEWLEKTLKEKTPLIEVEELTAKGKVLKVFSKTKDKQVIGARCESGVIKIGSQIKIIRRDTEIGKGKIKGLQMQKIASESISEGNEFGALIESKTEIVPGDIFEIFQIVTK